jgi:hypothetical protein
MRSLRSVVGLVWPVFLALLAIVLIMIVLPMILAAAA